MTTDVVEPESFTYHESDSNPNSELELLQAGGRKPSRKTGRKTGRQEDGREDEQDDKDDEDDVVKYTILGD